MYSKVIDKLQELIDEVVGLVDWMLAGCPQPVKIPVRIKDDRQKREDRPHDD